MSQYTEFAPAVNPYDEPTAEDMAWLAAQAANWDVPADEDLTDYDPDCKRLQSPVEPALADAVEREMIYMRGRQGEVWQFIADQLERLLQLIRFTGATTPAEFADRFEVLEADRDSTHYDAGFAEGRRNTLGLEP
jgi:hypothetical protein